jgi:hypothetical protein
MRREADGSVAVTVVDGTTRVGLFAADGSINVVLSDGVTLNKNVYHPCGALNVTLAPTAGVGAYAPDGTLYVSEDNTGGIFVSGADIEGAALDLPRVSWDGGSDYWSQFPKANAAGWSDPSFFPIAVFLGKVDSGHPAALASLGINTYMAAEHQTPISQATDEVFVIIHRDISDGDWTSAEVGNDPNVVGYLVYDECEQGEGVCWLDGVAADRLPLFQSWCEDYRALNDGRFIFANFGNGVLNSFWAQGIMDQWMALVDGCAVDKYAYTSPGVRFEIGRSDDWTATGTTEEKEDAAQSSAAYGWFMDQMRTFDADNPSRRPIWGFVETKKPFLGEDPAGIILYEEIEGAVWNAITHEARGVCYFQHNGFYPPDVPATDPNTGAAPTEEVYSLVDGQAALKSAVSAINTKINSLAPVINTQSYVWDFSATGVDTMLKVYDGFAYIFACLGVQAATGNKTFTLPTGTGGATAEVVGESRTVNIAGGAFTDNFANEYTHHVYKVALT